MTIQTDEEVIKEPSYIQTPDRVKSMFASTFSALITEKDEFYFWGPFLSEEYDMMNPFDSEEFQEEMARVEGHNENSYS